jgi:ABC-type iron transport system FetAB permease component
MEKEQTSDILFFYGKKSCSRSRQLVLWSLGTLTGQQRFYGTGLVTQKERWYHPLSVLPKAGCIAGFV